MRIELGNNQKSQVCYGDCVFIDQNEFDFYVRSLENAP